MASKPSDFVQPLSKQLFKPPGPFLSLGHRSNVLAAPLIYEWSASSLAPFAPKKARPECQGLMACRASFFQICFQLFFLHLFAAHVSSMKIT